MLEVKQEWVVMQEGPLVLVQRRDKATRAGDRVRVINLGTEPVLLTELELSWQWVGSPSGGKHALMDVVMPGADAVLLERREVGEFPAHLQIDRRPDAAIKFTLRYTTVGGQHEMRFNVNAGGQFLHEEVRAVAGH